MSSPENEGRPPQAPEGGEFDEQKRELWEQIKKIEGPARALKLGRELGVPEKEREEYAKTILDVWAAQKNYGAAYRFMINQNVGTPEERRSMGKKAYEHFFETDIGAAQKLAEELFGKESEEWRKAQKGVADAWKKADKKLSRQEKKEEEGQDISLKETAAFPDLFATLDLYDEEVVQFQAEVIDQFGSKIADEIENFRSSPPSFTVLEYFKNLGIDKKEIEAKLPLKFKKPRKK